MKVLIKLMLTILLLSTFISCDSLGGDEKALKKRRVKFISNNAIAVRSLDTMFRVGDTITINSYKMVVLE